MPELSVSINAHGATIGARKFEAAAKRVMRNANLVNRSVRRMNRSFATGTAGMQAYSGAVASSAAVAGASFHRASTAITAGAVASAASVRNLEKATGGFASTFAARAKTIALSGAVFASAFALKELISGTVTSIRSYETAIARGAAVTNGFAGQMKEAEETAKTLGATTVFTASEVAEGMAFLGQAGFKANEIIAGISGTLNLAVAGQLDLADAADLASNVLKQFALSAEETNRVADVLAQTARNSNTNVRQLGEAFKLVGPIANSLGITLEQTAAAVGVLGNAGIQATLAGTALRQGFLSTVAVSDKAADALAGMELSTQDLNIQQRGLVDVLKSLRDANIGAEQASAIFQRRAAAGILILTQNVDVLEELEELNKEAEGTAKRMAAVMQDTLDGAFREVSSAIEAFSLATGDAGATGVMKSFLKNVAGVTRVMAGFSDETLKSSGAMQSQIEKWRAMEEAISVVLKVVATLVAIKLASWLVSGTAALAGMVAAQYRLAAATHAATTATMGWMAATTGLGGALAGVAAVGRFLFSWPVAIGALALTFLSVGDSVSSVNEELESMEDIFNRIAKFQASSFIAPSGRQMAIPMNPHDTEQAKKGLQDMIKQLGSLQKEADRISLRSSAALFGGMGGGSAFKQEKRDMEDLNARIQEAIKNYNDYSAAVTAGEARQAEVSQRRAEIELNNMLNIMNRFGQSMMSEDIKDFVTGYENDLARLTGSIEDLNRIELGEATSELGEFFSALSGRALQEGSSRVASINRAMQSPEGQNALMEAARQQSAGMGPFPFTDAEGAKTFLTGIVNEETQSVLTALAERQEALLKKDSAFSNLMEERQRQADQKRQASLRQRLAQDQDAALQASGTEIQIMENKFDQMEQAQQEYFSTVEGRRLSRLERSELEGALNQRIIAEENRFWRDKSLMFDQAMVAEQEKILQQNGEVIDLQKLRHSMELDQERRKWVDIIGINEEQWAILEEKMRERQRKDEENLDLVEKFDLTRMRNEFDNLFRTALMDADNFGDALERLGLAIIEITAQSLILRPILDGLFGKGPAGTGGLIGPALSGAFSFLSAGFNSVLGSASSAIKVAPAGSVGDLGGGLVGVPHGGQFTVPGSGGGGRDNRIVSFAAMGGENVRVLPPGSSGSEPIVNINIETPPGMSAQQTGSRQAGSVRDIDLKIVQAVSRNIQQGGDVFQSISSRSKGRTR